MPDINATLTGPIGVIVQAAANVAVAALNYASVVRAGMSDANKDSYDKMQLQIYEDWRAFLQNLNIVGPKLP